MRARAIAAWANGLLDRNCTMEDRRALIEQLGIQVRRFEVKRDGGSISISANGEEDTRQ
jgi:hypothetical protein